MYQALLLGIWKGIKQTIIMLIWQRSLADQGSEVGDTKEQGRTF